jgi:hypothetical protein
MNALRYEVEYAKAPDLEAFARRYGELEIEHESTWGKQFAGDPEPGGNPRDKSDESPPQRKSGK